MDRAQDVLISFSGRLAESLLLVRSREKWSSPRTATTFPDLHFSDRSHGTVDGEFTSHGTLAATALGTEQQAVYMKEKIKDHG